MNSPREKDIELLRRNSENPIQENTSVPVTSLTYLKAFPSLSMVHSHLQISPNHSNPHANYILHPPEGVCLGGLPTFLPRPDSNVTSCGALRDSPHIKAACPECSPAHTSLSTKGKCLTCITSRMNSTRSAIIVYSMFVPLPRRVLKCLNQALNIEA